MRADLRNGGAALTAALIVILAGGPSSAGSPQQPEVTDDNTGEAAIPPSLDVRDGWVANESSTSFSVFMRMAALEPPANASVMFHYHFHFQVERTDGNTSLYHAMVHRSFPDAWTFLVQRWLPSGGTGAWGETNEAGGRADPGAGLIEVVVVKALVASPRVDFQRGTWDIDRFYIHADAVDAPSGAVLASDAAPAVGTMGSYSVHQGAPPQAGGTASGAGVMMGLAALGAAGLVFALKGRRQAGGPSAARLPRALRWRGSR